MTYIYILQHTYGECAPVEVDGDSDAPEGEKGEPAGGQTQAVQQSPRQGAEATQVAHSYRLVQRPQHHGNGDGSCGSGGGLGGGLVDCGVARF